MLRSESLPKGGYERDDGNRDDQAEGGIRDGVHRSRIAYTKSLRTNRRGAPKGEPPIVILFVPSQPLRNAAPKSNPFGAASLMA